MELIKMKYLVLLSLALLTRANEPNLKASVSQALPHTFVSILLPFGCGYLTNYTLGDFTVDLPTSIGTVHATLDNTVLNTILMNFATSGVTFDEPKFVTLALKDLDLTVSFDYDFKIDLFKEKGHGTAQVSNTDFVASVYFENAPDGSLAIKTEQLSLTIGSVKITSSMGRIISGIIDVAIREEKPKIERQIEDLVSQYIAKANATLANYTYIFEVPVVNVPVDVHADVFKVVDGYLVGGVKGTLTDPKTGSVIPNNGVDLPDVDGGLTEQVQLFANSYVLDAALKILADGFSYTVSSFPPSVPLHLTTTGLAFLIPELQATFGADKPVSITISGNSTKPNSVTINNNMEVECTLDLDYKVETETGWEPALTMDMGIDLALSGSLVGTTLHVQIGKFEITSMSVPSSHVGPVDPASLKQIFGIVLAIVKSEVNGYLADLEVTFPKIPYIKISEDHALFNSGFLELAFTLEPNFF